MRDKRYVICGNVSYDIPKEFETKAIHVHLYGSDDEFKLEFKIEVMKGLMLSNIPKRYEDLLNIAAYVVAGDQISSRGQESGYQFDRRWNRDFHFVIPVREFDFWNAESVKDRLRSLLRFLSDDEYTFEFLPMKNIPSSQRFFDINPNGELHGSPEQVVMFSGGLDSLGGAIEETIKLSKRIVCVNHRSNTKNDKRHEALGELLREKAGAYAPRHVRMTSHKQEWMGREYTQRTRSFLFVALGATIAKLLGLSSVRFYENGVVSLNLPVCAQVVGGRATRTTHPKSLAGFQELLTTISESPVQIDNPFAWKTKVEVIRSIIDAGCQDLIQHSVSCAHVWTTSNEHPHCGTCSQCIDRRFAIIAAKAETFDPPSQFAADIFMEGREKDAHIIEDKTMFATYVDRANTADDIQNSAEFLQVFAEASRVLEYVDGSRQSALERILNLYKRHARDVQAALDVMLVRDPKGVRTLTIPPNSLLRIVMDRSYPVSVPATPAVEESPNNIFRRRGNVWELRFNGQTSFNLSNCDTGCRHIHRLITNPNKKFEVWYLVHWEKISILEDELRKRADHPDAAQRSSKNTIDPDGISKLLKKSFHQSDQRTDGKALYETQQKLEELREELDEIKNDPIRQEKLTEEIEKINAQLAADTGMGGKIRREGKKMGNNRTSFYNAVKRAIDTIRETDVPFADYLKNSITCGANPVYNPPSPIQWETDHVTNS